MPEYRPRKVFLCHHTQVFKVSLSSHTDLFSQSLSKCPTLELKILLWRFQCVQHHSSPDHLDLWRTVLSSGRKERCGSSLHISTSSLRVSTCFMNPATTVLLCVQSGQVHWSLWRFMFWVTSVAPLKLEEAESQSQLWLNETTCFLRCQSEADFTSLKTDDQIVRELLTLLTDVFSNVL